MTSFRTTITALATANYLATDPNGGVRARDTNNAAVTGFFADHFRTATGALGATAVGDFIFVLTTGANQGGYYVAARCVAKNATVDGVATQDSYALLTPWMNRNPALIGTIPGSTATIDSYRTSSPMSSYGKIVIESITCPRNTTAGAGTLTLQELSATAASGLLAGHVFSVQTAATFSPVSIRLSADGLSFDGPVLFTPSAATVDWDIVWRGRSPADMSKFWRNLSLSGPAL